MMGQYLPYANTHSIQEAVVGIHFQELVSTEAVTQALSTARNELKNEFPRINQFETQEISIKNNVQEQQTPRLAGFELSDVKLDAKPARIVRLMDKMLTVNFLEYPTWSATLENSLRYIKTILLPLTLATNPVMAFSLRYIDRYTFDGPDDKPNAGVLLQTSNAYIAPHCFNSGSLWHCYSGWFEMLAPKNRVLNQLNVSSAIVDGASTVTIDHNAICQLRVPRQTVESLFQPKSTESTDIENTLEHLHNRNSNVLRSMLQPEMLDKIGLNTPC